MRVDELRNQLENALEYQKQLREELSRAQKELSQNVRGQAKLQHKLEEETRLKLALEKKLDKTLTELRELNITHDRTLQANRNLEREKNALAHDMKDLVRKLKPESQRLKNLDSRNQALICTNKKMEGEIEELKRDKAELVACVKEDKAYIQSRMQLFADKTRAEFEAIRLRSQNSNLRKQVSVLQDQVATLETTVEQLGSIPNSPTSSVHARPQSPYACRPSRRSQVVDSLIDPATGVPLLYADDDPLESELSLSRTATPGVLLTPAISSDSILPDRSTEPTRSPVPSSARDSLEKPSASPIPSDYLLPPEVPDRSMSPPPSRLEKFDEGSPRESSHSPINRPGKDDAYKRRNKKGIRKGPPSVAGSIGAVDRDTKDRERGEWGYGHTEGNHRDHRDHRDRDRDRERDRERGADETGSSVGVGGAGSNATMMDVQAEYWITLHGPAREGKTLTATIHGLHKDSKEKVALKWFRRTPGASESNRSIAAVGPTSYDITREDIGFLIGCGGKIEDDDMFPSPGAASISGMGAVSVGPVWTTVIEPSEPRASSLRIAGETVEGSVVSASVVYFGGREGASEYTWVRPDGTLTHERTYRIGKEDVGHPLVLRFTPVRSDGRRGETVETKSSVVTALFPRIDNIDITWDRSPVSTSVPTYNTELRVCGDYVGGHEGESTILWYRSFSEAATDVVGHRGKDLDVSIFEDRIGRGRSLKLSLSDKGSVIAVSYQPTRNDDVSGEWEFAVVGPIRADPAIAETVKQMAAVGERAFELFSPKGDPVRAVLTRKRLSLSGPGIHGDYKLKPTLLVIPCRDKPRMFFLEKKGTRVGSFETRTPEERDYLCLLSARFAQDRTERKEGSLRKRSMRNVLKR
eukprot:Rmarinus@m.16264